VVETLREGLLKTDMGIVAHYYMDVELQGVLQSLKQSHPELEHRIGIADSLKMGDLAVKMCQSHGVTSVVCLGVDFMSESVQAILVKNGMEHIPVYRAKSQAIGCSLAQSAEGDAYRAWLQQESARAMLDSRVPLHVIYINTSLETKAVSSSIVPTITCTSSNVLHTLLQAAHEIPNVRFLYGPDTYMGQNLIRMFQVILESPDWTDAKIAAELHPHHSKATLQTLHDNLVVFPQGNCVVHHMFGAEVVDTVKDTYYNEPNTYMTAHLEVPGEMFEIAMTKSLTDEGVVGSTSDILTFITRKVQEAASANKRDYQRLRFVLGTEAGMVTSIVKNVQDVLDQQKDQNVEAEIIFPVSAEAVMSTDGDVDAAMPLVPGVAGGEGCSTAGGCATCPFMKMNDLDALLDIIQMVDDIHHQQPSQAGNKRSKSEIKLSKHLPPTRLRGKTIGGVDATELGSEAILYMRQFMQAKGLPVELVQKVTAFGKNSDRKF
jgi:quinolinate synthase